MAAQVAKVRARTRPWKSIIALVLALACLAGAELGRHDHLDSATATGLMYGGAVAFFGFGTAAVFGLTGQARHFMEPVIGAAHAGVARYALVLAGEFTVLVVALNLASVPVGQLVVGGAVASVLLGIAAQQSLANLFAGMVLLFARPFRVGDRVRFRAGALYGMIEGTVTDVSITYVRMETAEGVIFIPNSQALAATVGPVPAAEREVEPAVERLSAAEAAQAAEPALPEPAAPEPAMAQQHDARRPPP